MEQDEWQQINYLIRELQDPGGSDWSGSFPAMVGELAVLVLEAPFVCPEKSSRRYTRYLMHPWYALKVRTRGESLVGTVLQRKDYEIFLPTYQESRKYSDRIKKVDTPLFPGYLFCRLDASNRLPILTTPGVDYILGTNGEPEPLPENEIESIQKVVRGGSARPWPFLKTGSRVRVEHGAFTGVEGILLTERGADRLILSISLLQRSVSVEIDRTWIRPI